MTVGERIKSRRKELGISADELAQLIGVDRTSMFRYEKGTIEKMPVRSLVPLAEALHVDPVWLLTGRETETQKPAPSKYDSLFESRPELLELLTTSEALTKDQVLQLISIARVLK